MLTGAHDSKSRSSAAVKSLEQVGEKAMSVPTRLEQSPVASTRLDDRTREIEEVDKRIQKHEGGCQAGGADDAEGGRPDGRLRKHREAVQQLSSQAMQTQASLETLKKERAGARGSPRTASAAPRPKVNSLQAGTLKGELDQIRSAATTLHAGLHQYRESSREGARGHDGGDGHCQRESRSKLGPARPAHE